MSKSSTRSMPEHVPSMEVLDPPSWARLSICPSAPGSNDQRDAHAAR
jgi:hypothetical protein